MRVEGKETYSREKDIVERETEVVEGREKRI